MGIVMIMVDREESRLFLTRIILQGESTAGHRKETQKKMLIWQQNLTREAPTVQCWGI